MSGAMFRLEIQDDVARLTLARGEARNAIPAEQWDALSARIETVAASSARLLLVTGSDVAFCAGADLDDFPAMLADEAARRHFRTAMRRALDALHALDIPTIAYVEGPCFGAGVALALACDLRVAGKNARFAITPAKLGISYPQEDIHRLVGLVGRGQAARLLFTAEIIGAAEAERIGLIEYRVPDAGMADFLQAFLAVDAGSVKALKRGIGLAAQGAAHDAAQDESFDALLGGEALARRLEALRRK